VESALEYVFEHYGPWAQFKSKTDWYNSIFLFSFMFV
jgi:hypothetical protein